MVAQIDAKVCSQSDDLVRRVPSYSVVESARDNVRADQPLFRQLRGKGAAADVSQTDKSDFPDRMPGNLIENLVVMTKQIAFCARAVKPAQ